MISYLIDTTEFMLQELDEGEDDLIVLDIVDVVVGAVATIGIECCGPHGVAGLTLLHPIDEFLGVIDVGLLADDILIATATFESLLLRRLGEGINHALFPLR